MRIVFSDSTCIIDLHKVELLCAVLELPYSFVIAHTLFDDGLQRLTAAEKTQLQLRGLEVHELDGAGVTHAVDDFNAHPALHLNDCFALRLAEELDDAMLMTANTHLRALAVDKSIEACSVLWAADELDRHGRVERDRLQNAMRVFRDDPLVSLPLEALRRRIRRFGQQRT